MTLGDAPGHLNILKGIGSDNIVTDIIIVEHIKDGRSLCYSFAIFLSEGFRESAHYLANQSLEVWQSRKVGRT